jgi:hypothetical protein
MKAAVSERRGYAMVLVLLFLVLFLALLGVAYREMAAAVRTVSVQSLEADRDEGSLHALARAMALLETGLPPANPYVCGATIDTSAGPRSFRVTFTSPADTTWSVRSAPASPDETLLPMPSTFAVPPP